MGNQKTRARLQETALRLFTERGFDAVTVEEIARAAGVSHMTFFRYFPTKESVVMEDTFDPLIAEAVAAQDAAKPVIRRVVDGLDAVISEMDPADEANIRERVRLAVGHSALRARIWENNQSTLEAIVASLAEGATADGEAHAAAGAALGALTAALLHWAEASRDVPLSDSLRSALWVMTP